MNWKKVALGCSISSAVLVVIIAVGGYFAFRHFRKFIPGRMEIPKNLIDASVLTGSDLLSKKTFFEDSRLGKITDIELGELDPSPGQEIGIAGSRGAAFLDEEARLKSTIMFSGETDDVNIIEINADGVCEFLNRGSWGVSASLMDHKGNVIWTYSDETGVDDMDSGDMDGDGTMEFVVGFNGGGGVHLVDINGKKKWSESDGNVWHVEFVDTNGDGILEIVHSNAGGQMTIRDQNGKVVRRTHPGPYFSHFSLCKWPTQKDHEYALLAENDTIWIFDFDGKTVAQFTAPKCGTLGHARGTPVKLMADQPEYFATLVEFRHWNRAILYVHDRDGKLMYQEILPETCASIAALSLSDSKTDTLLVGGDGKVWQYKAGNNSDKH
ncbi:hypothetical protein HZA56_11635 [Candidatus Poribacteria bacterium]|nr:hypothetical protein [Candidatus Poribacteria bacterium]